MPHTVRAGCLTTYNRAEVQVWRNGCNCGEMFFSLSIYSPMPTPRSLSLTYILWLSGIPLSLFLPFREWEPRLAFSTNPTDQCNNATPRFYVGQEPLMAMLQQHFWRRADDPRSREPPPLFTAATTPTLNLNASCTTLSIYLLTPQTPPLS